MKQISKRLTYANVMSSIAVFLVLGGATAFAANQLGKNTVGSKQLKKNSVTAAKLKKNAVTGAKIKNGTITGSKVKAGSLTGASINASTLGTVPSATNATNATNFSRYTTTGLKKLSVGQTATLGTAGPFTITGHCKDAGSGYYEATTTISTSQPHSFLYGHSLYDEADFEPGNEIEIGENNSSENPYWYDPYDDDSSGWTAASPDGSLVLKGLSTNGVHVFGADCAYVVTWMNNA